MKGSTAEIERQAKAILPRPGVGALVVVLEAVFQLRDRARGELEWNRA